MRLHSSLIVAAFASAAVVAVSAQQDPRPQDQRPQDQRPQDQRPQDRGIGAGRADGQDAMESTSRDGFLATWILIENRNEIALARLAKDRAQSPEVKKFAQSMTDDHGKLGQKLQPYAAKVGYVAASDTRGESRGEGRGETGGEGRGERRDGNDTGRDDQSGGRTSDGQTKPTNGNDPQQDRSGESTSRRDDARGQRGSFGDTMHVSLLQDLGAQCLQSGRKELEQKSGDEFDRCFMLMQIGGHMKMHDELTVFEKHASPELKVAFTEARKSVEMHLQQAKDVSKRLEAAATKTNEGR